MKKLLTLTAVAVLSISSLAMASENIVVNTDSLPSSLSKSSARSIELVEVKGAGVKSDFIEFYFTPKGLAGNSVSQSSDDDTYIVFGVDLKSDKVS